MLVLGRNPKERIVITLPDGRKIEIVNLSRRTRLAIKAPKDCHILRGELEAA